MSWRWVEHTAELELELEAPSEQGVFAEALRALAELLEDEPALVEDEPADDPGETISIELRLAGHDRALLLADWLDELVFRAETETIVPRALERLELNDAGLSAVVRAVRAEPRPLVKGVTHHRLRFDCSPERCRARLVLDV